MKITFDNVHHIYMEKTPFETTALKDITVTLPEGTCSAVIGRTGSGKSTLVQHINGLLKPTSGKVMVGDQIIHAKTKRKQLKLLRRQVGMVFQYPEHQLFEDTVEKDLLFGPKNIGLNTTKIKKKLPELLELVGLEPSLLERSPFDLSGGQMRRVAIASVLAMEPNVLILDEPTAGLDPKGQEDILTLLKDWQEKYQITMIIITHQMEEASRLAEKLIVMDNGQIAMEGRPEDIYAQNQMLQQLDLDVPERVKVLKYLEESLGIRFSKWSLTPKEAASELNMWMKKEKNHV
ncbi:energy-coupling factor transport system ATP-binding protein [Alteribacillus persepolensis]|uniref:Energy-coupling factor transporter ATP-binding protein EcfA2 n=1 Tax=Alteribacillus persepolensis TaxID=568899 RepID=A0A1G8HM34_9BACI|nr:energy-coupling factor transporter ATPase [Alteribacillus persepolensis]SDI07645.1 energy-coupling factor transport system ATP-binding protein [Alteribacillus persepolensis]